MVCNTAFMWVHSYLITPVPHPECSLAFHSARMIPALKLRASLSSWLFCYQFAAGGRCFFSVAPPHIFTSPGISYQSSQTPECLSSSLCETGRGCCCITAFGFKKELKRQLWPCAICMRSILAEFCWLLRLYSAVREGETGCIIPSITKHMEVCLCLASVHICLQCKNLQSKDNEEKQITKDVKNYGSQCS